MVARIDDGTFADAIAKFADNCAACGTGAPEIIRKNAAQMEELRRTVLAATNMGLNT